MSDRQADPNYKWITLSNTTLGTFTAFVNSNIVVIALAPIFAGIGIQPLGSGETNYFLWMLLGYMVVTATLLVTFGRLSDMFGRVRLYNLGLATFTLGRQHRHSHECISGRAAWPGVGRQSDRHRRRRIGGADCRWVAGGHQLAVGFPGECGGRSVWHNLGLAEATRESHDSR